MKFIREIIQEYTKSEGPLIRNTISFALIMSMVPFIALLVVVFLHSHQSIELIIDALSGIIPANTIEEIINVGLYTNMLGFIPFIVTTGISYYTAARGFYSIILAFSLNSNKKSSHSIILQSLVSPLIFISLIILTVLFNSFILFILPNIHWLLNTILSLCIYICISIIFFGIISYPYQSLKHIMPGAILFAVCFTLLSDLFFIYINNFTHYFDFYGSLASIMIIILATKIISSLLHICHIINKKISWI